MMDAKKEFRELLDRNLEKEIVRRLRPLGLLNLFFLFVFIAGLMSWIWVSWLMVAKIAGTGFLGLLITAGVYHFLKVNIKKEIAKKLEDLAPPDPKKFGKSQFQQRLEEMEANRKKSGCTDWCGQSECRQFCNEKRDNGNILT